MAKQHPKADVYTTVYKVGDVARLRIDVRSCNSREVIAHVWYRCRTTRHGVRVKVVQPPIRLADLPDTVAVELPNAGYYELFVRLTSKTPASAPNLGAGLHVNSFLVVDDRSATTGT